MSASVLPLSAHAEKTADFISNIIIYYFRTNFKYKEHRIFNIFKLPLDMRPRFMIKYQCKILIPKEVGKMTEPIMIKSIAILSAD